MNAVVSPSMNDSRAARRVCIPQHGAWIAFALVLVVAPWIFHGAASLSILSQVGTLMIFGLSYNMLLGQSGMLSFGHAVYSGLGAFIAIHAMNLAGKGSLPVPVTLIPLVGGLAGMGFGILFGYVTTKKSGTTFAMITLGIVELVFACSLMLPHFFGGEGGISTDRVIGKPFLGISYGPQIQVYYLIAFWLFISAAGMYGFTKTPLGRIANAVRDNAERAAFVAYDTQWVRYLTLILSAFFAGISGALSAINFEIVTAENVSAARSGAILLFTFIGGIDYFGGPILGALVGVLLTVILPEYTEAWQLYLGVFFIAIVMYAPGGLASLIMRLVRIVKGGEFRQVTLGLAAVCIALLIAVSGAILAVEMLYHLSLDSADGSTMTLFGIVIDTSRWSAWIVSAVLLACGAAGYKLVEPESRRAWSEAMTRIEHAAQGDMA